MKDSYEKLKCNICEITQENQIKLGYRKEVYRLYYPMASLKHLLRIQGGIPELYKELELFCREVQPELGPIQISNKAEQFCLLFSAQASEYVHTHLGENDFLAQFLATVSKHDCTLEELIAVFQAYSEQVHVEQLTDADFDYLIYFTNGEPNDFRYCLTMEECHIIYHRFTPEDYADFGFPKGKVLRQ